MRVGSSQLPARFEAPDHKLGGGGAKPPGSNRILQGIGNGVFTIVNNVAVRIHSHKNAFEIIERQLQASEVAGEIEKLGKLRAYFAPADKPPDVFLLIVNEMIDNAVTAIKTDEVKINAEAALYRTASKFLQDQKQQIASEEGKAEILRLEMHNLTKEGIALAERYKVLGSIDQRLGELRNIISRQKVFMADMKNLLERMIVFLQTQDEENYVAGEAHVSDNLSWPEIQDLFAHGASAIVLNSALTGPANHPFIFAHQNGLPMAVINSPLTQIEVSHRISLDARTGQVIINPSEATVQALENRQRNYGRLAKYFKESLAKTETLDGEKLPALQVNIKDRADFVGLKGQSVGLFRLEGLFASARPTIQSLVRVFKDVMGKAKAVNFRLFDVARDKIPAFFTAEDKAELERTGGGIAFLLNSKTGREILVDELKAILIAYDRLNNSDHDMAKKTVRLILPMVTNPEEVRALKMILKETEADLIERKLIKAGVSENLKIGVMIETSAAVANVELLAAEVSYFSIGANDLTQDLLGFKERNKLMTDKQYDWLSPIVLAKIKQVIDLAKQKGVMVGSCGEISHDPLAAIVLTLMGIDWLSMDDSYRPETNYVLTNIYADEWRKFSQIDPDGLPVIDRVLKKPDALAVREFLFNLIKTNAHADTQIALEDVITAARPITYRQ